jgi:lipoprotein-anchoring transpeptidase ErfK/SrfK
MAKKSEPTSIHVSIAKQELRVKRGRKTLRVFPVSTSRFGLGSEERSMKTPLGRFRVAEKIGDGLPPDTAFKSRKPVRLTRRMLADDDLIMSRILWLDGLEAQNANSRDRYIYIHGTNHEDDIGRPASHGCVRMRNADVAELFEMVAVDTPVVIAAPRSIAKRNQRGDSPAMRARAYAPVSSSQR